ncbi:MAG TPA: MerR family transcriptional regulator, partial [Byssovorax sp.]
RDIMLDDMGATSPEMTIHELAEASGIGVRTIRQYVRRGLLPPPRPRGPRTRYGREYLVRLRAVAALRAQRLGIDDIARRIAALSRDEIEALAGMTPPAAPAPPPPRPPELPVPRALDGGFLGPYRAEAARGAETWEHLTVCPGVVLLVKAEADSESWRVAREILVTFRAG